MSGFEIAGVTLAAWPILIEALKFYAEERGVIKDFCNCQPLTRSILRQLKREKVTFENSAKCLLNAAAQQSNRSFEETKQMMCTPHSIKWNEETDNCGGIFSQETAILYTDTRKDLEEILDSVQACFNKRKDPNKRTTKHQWQRLLLAIKQDQIEIQVHKAEGLNRFLVNLTRENVLSAKPERKVPVRSAKHYKTIREHANLMANALQRKLLKQECLCQLTHDASLVLEVRQDRRRVKDNCFRILFGFEAGDCPPPWSIREMEIQACEILPTPPENSEEPVLEAMPTIVVTAAPKLPAPSPSRERSPSSEPSPKVQEKRSIIRGFIRSLSSSSSVSKSASINETNNTTPTSATAQVTITTKQVHSVAFKLPEKAKAKHVSKEIQSLCAAISDSQALPSWSGVLSLDRNILQEIRIASNALFTVDPNACIVSLADLLSTGLWKTEPRSKLGLKLAPTVLQLYRTPWLGDDWGKDDILFVQQGDGKVLIDRPFLKPGFAVHPPIGPAQNNASMGTINMHVPTLYALGVVLIELYYKTSIDELQRLDRGLNANPTDEPEILHLRRTLFILRLIKEMEAGANYRRVVLQCIKGPDGALTDLNQQELCDMVEEKIIIPLENEVSWVSEI